MYDQNESFTKYSLLSTYLATEKTEKTHFSYLSPIFPDDGQVNNLEIIYVMKNYNY